MLIHKLFGKLIVLLLSSCLFISAAGAKGTLKMVVVEVESTSEIAQLRKLGFDIAAIRERKSGKIYSSQSRASELNVEVVVSPKEIEQLENMGFQWRLFKSGTLQPNAQQRSLDAITKQLAETVYHSFDEPELGIEDQLIELEEEHHKILSLEVIGESIQKRPIYAVKLTKGNCKRWDRKCQRNKNKKKNKKKPKVLFHATTHAREWVATQMAMRLIKYLANNYGGDKRVTDLLKDVEVWIIPVVNPDGYEYTFTDERLWRKNLRDNDGDGQITSDDGVDLNRNLDFQWGRDEEGSSSNISSNTYRGPSPGSEPETKALKRFVLSKKFAYTVSYHTYGNLILYPNGWQFSTTSLDDPIFLAQAGTDDNPAIYDSLNDVGYNPGVGADLYITNGDYVAWAYNSANIPSYTVELTDGHAFEFPDDEAMVQTVFEDNLEFALSVAESARDPANPVSPVGIAVEDIYHEPVTTSYGSTQMVEILARNKSKYRLLYQVNGKWRWAKFRAAFGETYNTKKGVYFTRYVANIRRQKTGSIQQYYIVSGKNKNLGPYSYTAVSVTNNPVLVMAAEDYSGEFPDYVNNTSTNYLDYYTKALDDNNIGYDVWDVDQKGIADYRQVLSHYDSVIWYTGDDYAPTVPLGVNDTQIAEMLEMREYLNYRDGKLFATGQDISSLATVFGIGSDDFYQYYLGADSILDGAGVADGQPFPVSGMPSDPIFDGLNFEIQGGTGANNQHTNDLMISLGADSFLKPVISASYDLPGGAPFEPHSGDKYVYSQQSSLSYERLGGSFTLPSGAGNLLSFWASYLIESNWDFFFVEVCESGTDICTTLPELSGLSATETGESCLSGITGVHSTLSNYMDADCNPKGDTGEWNAITGNSGGWKLHQYDLQNYAGETVDIYITYMTDWGTELSGVLVDDVSISGYPEQDFEVDQVNWPSGTAPGTENLSTWLLTSDLMIATGSVIRTEDTVLMGFGFEAIDTDKNRKIVMDKVIDYLLPRRPKK